MHVLKTFLSMVFAATLLTACGGGSSTTETSPKLNITGEALYAAYDKITIGMKYEQVRALVGVDPNIPPKTPQIEYTSYTWSSGTTAMGVGFFAASGLILSKSIDGPPRKSESSGYQY